MFKSSEHEVMCFPWSQEKTDISVSDIYTNHILNWDTSTSSVWNRSVVKEERKMWHCICVQRELWPLGPLNLLRHHSFLFLSFKIASLQTQWSAALLCGFISFQFFFFSFPVSGVLIAALQHCSCTVSATVCKDEATSEQKHLYPALQPGINSKPLMMYSLSWQVYFYGLSLDCAWRANDDEIRESASVLSISLTDPTSPVRVSSLRSLTLRFYDPIYCDFLFSSCPLIAVIVSGSCCKFAATS